MKFNQNLRFEDFGVAPRPGQGGPGRDAHVRTEHGIRGRPAAKTHTRTRNSI